MSASGYLSEDTIAAISTALGGAVSIVRISGPRAFDALERLGVDPKVAQLGEPRKLYRAELKGEGGKALDDALVARFVGPFSFTGEDVVELHLHGGTYIATRVLETLVSGGVRQALPGEFSFRAVRTGKISITQAQAIADLIAAANDGAVSLALEKLSGSQGKLIRDLAEGIRKVAMLGEIGIDFNDQDLDEVSLPTLRRNLVPYLEKLESLRKSFGKGIRLQEGIGVAFVGLPNAGKSSFFNALLGEERSIVTEVAGTTRDVVKERITLRGQIGSITLRLEDTAGLRNASDQVERIGIERTIQAAKDADLVLFLVDGTSDTQSLHDALEEWRRIGSPSQKALGIVTKSDLMDEAERRALAAETVAFGIDRWVETSAVTGQGIDDSVEAIVATCESWVHREPGEVVLTRVDHMRAVENALESLERARSASEIDLFAADVRQGLLALSPLIGETVPDDILGQIFSNFCIGK